MQYSFGLTIVIPTYNRRNSLCRMLYSIMRQGHYNDYSLIILDNHSNYSIEHVLKEEFPKEFCDRIKLIRWKFNVGMSTNLSLPFLICKTQWMWLLADDDEIAEGALAQILEDIKKNDDVVAIKYSLDNYSPHEDSIISSIEEFVDYFGKGNRIDLLMYLSNVYNLNVLYPYLSNITDYSYTYISFTIPIIKAVIDNKKLKLSSAVFVNYNPDSDDNWSKVRFREVLLGYRTYSDITFVLSDGMQKRLLNVVFSPFPIHKCYNWLIANTSKNQMMSVWQKIDTMNRYREKESTRFKYWLMVYSYSRFGRNIFHYIFAVYYRIGNLILKIRK